MKILIVEDDKFFASLMAEAFDDHGLSSKIVLSVEEAIQQNLDRFQAAVIDIMLPNNPVISALSHEETRGGFLSGVALARKIIKRKPKLPIILLSSGVIGDEAERWAREKKIPFFFKHEGNKPIFDEFKKLKIIPGLSSPRAFIIHGHDEALLREFKNYLKNKLKWQRPIILRETPSLGKTLIEKFEESALKIDIIFVLMSPDDLVKTPRTNDDKRRARQNVIFELGFFYGQEGRKSGRIIVLKKGPVELPSDIQGIAWIDVKDGIMKKDKEIRREIKAALDVKC